MWNNLKKALIFSYFFFGTWFMIYFLFDNNFTIVNILVSMLWLVIGPIVSLLHIW